MKFDYIVLADPETTKGKALMLKCFYEGKGGEGRFYLNFNFKTGKGEIISQDPAYNKILQEAFKKTFPIKT